jgi:hypothetical protein
MGVFGAVAGGLVAFVALGAPQVSALGNLGARQSAEPPNEATAGTALLDCAQSILEQQGESILRHGAQPGRLLTWPHQVGRDELAGLALLTDPERADWLEGMYQIQVTVVPDGAGVSQLEVEARILGRQRTSLQLLRPSPWQRLESSGVLEQEVNSELAECSTSGRADAASET